MKCDLLLDFLNAQRVRPVEIIGSLWRGMVNDGNVRKWCRLFNEGRTNVLDGEKSGRLTDKNEDDTNNKLMRKFTKKVASLLTSFMRNFREFQGL